MINPDITQRFVRELQAVKSIYRINIPIAGELIPLDIYPHVFPPKSGNSASSKSVYKSLGILNGKRVADIGCGSGVESIAAILAGAEHVDACDISDWAVACSQHNVELNGLTGKISICESDLFGSLAGKYEMIIANLPIVDFQPENIAEEELALYDPGLMLHRRLLNEAKDYLATDGIITFTHANLQSANMANPDEDFEKLERLIVELGYRIIERIEREEIGYKWINYKITPVA